MTNINDKLGSDLVVELILRRGSTVLVRTMGPATQPLEIGLESPIVALPNGERLTGLKVTPTVWPQTILLDEE